MIFAALAALAAGAIAGVFLASRHFMRKRLPAWAALLHGLGGATGFTLVLLIVVRQPEFSLARQALYLLIVTVALGCVNLLFHVRKIRHRTSLIVMHALCAVSGVSTLLYAALAPSSAPAAPAPAQPSAVAAASVPAVAAPGSAPTVATASSAPASPTATAAPPATSASAASSASSPKTASAAELRQMLARAVSFDSASTLVSADSAQAVDATATVLEQHPEITLLEVQGHADERGDDTQNIQLTRARAQAVVEALVAKGIARQRLRAAGYGSRCPADPECQQADAPASCHDASRYSRDRRVVFLPLRVGGTALKVEVACARGAALIPPADQMFQQPGAR